MKNLFTFRQRPNESLTSDTLSQVSAKCRMTLGRLSTLFLLLLLSFGFSSQAWGYDQAAGKHVYIDNSLIQATGLWLRIGHGSYCSAWPMTKVTNTNNLWHVTTDGWGGADAWTIADSNGWTGGNTVYQPSDKAADCWIKNELKYRKDAITNNRLYIPSSGESATENGCNVTYWNSSNNEATTSNLNSTQTLQQMVSNNGGDYALSTEACATVKISTYKMASTDATSATAVNSTISTGNSSTTCQAALTATVTCSVSNLKTCYTFAGWYEGTTLLSTEGTYQYQTSSAKTITARFTTYSLPNPTYVYFVKPSNEQGWGDAYFRIGHRSYTSVYQMNKVGYTNRLFYIKIDGWNGFHRWFFTNQPGDVTITDGYGSVSKSIYNVETSDCNTITHITNYIGANVTGDIFFSPLKADGTLSKNYEPSSYQSGRSTYYINDYAALTYGSVLTDVNKTITLKQQLSKDGGNSYSNHTKNLATTKVYSYKLTTLGDANAAESEGTMSNGQATCNAALTAGVRLNTASTITGYTFVSWNKSDGTQISTATTIDDNSTITCFDNMIIYARFKANSYTVQFNANGGTGTAPSNLTGYYDVNLSALPANTFSKTGYHFDGWNTKQDGTGDNYAAGATNVKNLSSTQGATVTLYAKWAPNTNTPYKVEHYQEKLTVPGDYTLIDTDNLTGTTGASVTPNTKSYTGFTAPSKQTVTIAANGSTVVTYNYTRTPYNITYNPAKDAGDKHFTYTTAPDSKKYQTQVDFTFTPDANYVISNVTAVDASSQSVTVTKVSENNYRIAQMPASNITVTVTPTLSTLTLTYGVHSSGNGTLSGKVGSTSIGASPATVNGGSTVNFTATPANGYEVEGWYSDQACTTGKHHPGVTTYDVLMDGNKTVYVKFKETQRTITVSKGTGIASVSPTSTSAYVATPSAKISATLADGYENVTWNLGSEITIAAGYTTSSNPIQVNATADGTITASATEIIHTVSVVSNDDSKGTVNVSSVNVGIATQSDNITATPKTGYYFTGWTIPDDVNIVTGSTSSTTIKINATADNKKITANFAPIEVYMEGRFRVRNNEGNWVYTGSNEDAYTNTDNATTHIPYVFTNNAYYLNTNATLAEVSGNAAGGQGRVFSLAAKSGSTWAGIKASTTSGDKDNFLFTPTDKSADVTNSGYNMWFKDDAFAHSNAGPVMIKYDPVGKTVSYCAPKLRLSYNGATATMTGLAIKKNDANAVADGLTEPTVTYYYSTNGTNWAEWTDNIEAQEGTYQLKAVATGNNEFGQPVTNVVSNIITVTVTTPAISAAITKINGADGSVIRINDELTITPTLQNVPDGAHYTICYHYSTLPAGSSIKTDVFTATGSGKDVNTFIDVEGDYVITVTLNDKACDQSGNINLATYYLNFHVKGDEITVYTKLEKSVNWEGHDVYYYKGSDIGSGSWPGVEMTYIGKDSADYEWYKRIITNYKQYAGGNMVFNDATDDYGLQQTVDVPMPEDDAFYFIKAAAQNGKRTTETLAQVDVTPRVILLTDTTSLYQYITIDAQGKAVFFLGDDIKYEYSVTAPNGAAVTLNSKNEFSPSIAGNYTLTIMATNRQKPSETVTNTFILRVATNPLTLTPSPTSGTIGSTVTLTLNSTQTLPSCNKTWTVIEPGSVDPVTFGTTTTTSTTYTTQSSGTYTYQVILLDNEGKIIGKAQTTQTVAAKDMHIKHPFVNKTNPDGNDWQWAPMTYEASDGTYIYYNNTSTNPSYYHKDKVANINNTGTDKGGRPEYTILNPDNVGDNTLAVFVYDLSANTVTVYNPTTQFRVKSETENGTFYSNAVSTNNADLSFFATQDGKLSWQTRTTSNFSWIDMDITITDKVTKDAVYTAKVAISADKPTNTLSNLNEYTGDFTVYTSLTAADAGTGSPTAANGLMTQFTKASSADYYNYYWVRFCSNGKQAAATVGNNINHNLSVALPYYLLPVDANVRYGYDNTTNHFQRTLLAGSGGDFLQIYGENLYTATDKETPITKDAKQNFTDGSDWIYTVSAAGDVTAEYSVTATILANYNNTQRWILAKSGLEADADAARTILNKDVATPEVYDLRILYDYKTNRLTAGWVPTGEPTFDKDVILIDQMIIRREGDNESSKVNIQKTGGIVVVDKMTTEFALDKSKEWDKWNFVSGSSGPKYMFYWLSLPYKCKISEIYGLGVYGEKFEIQRYRGDLRALGQAGSNFGASAWRKLKNTATMEANRGYVIALKLKESDFKSAEDKSYARLFFPSTESVKLAHETQTVLPENEDNATSNLHWDWYIMGNPLLTSDIAANLVTPTSWDQELNYVYTWDYANGDRIYTPMSLDEVTLQATHSYMVQAKGTLNWAYPTASNKAPTRTFEATEFASGDGFGKQDIRLNLMEDGNQVDKTYIMYRPNGTREYEIGRDLDKIINSGCSQMYSSMNEPLASICLNSEDEEMIPLTFIVTDKSAEYTVRLNKPMNNNLVPSIYDGQTGEYKNLSFGDVTLDLVKGTNAGRYFFVLKKNGVITNTDELNGNLYDQTQKVIMNDHLFIIRDGKLYDGVGASVK